MIIKGKLKILNLLFQFLNFYMVHQWPVMVIQFLKKE